MMTRVNCVPPSELTGKHLVAEYRELPRIFSSVAAAIARGEKPSDPRNPSAYKLGTGHMRFFYPRLGYLAKRQEALVQEMLRRGYQPQFISNLKQRFPDIPDIWWGDWRPTPEALAINRQRIRERLG